MGELPIFAFASNVNPWCSCQDVPYDKPNPWEAVEITLLGNNEGTWRWGKLDLNTDPDWKDFSYKFRVVKENGTWKIAYLQGFDLPEALKGPAGYD